MEAVGRAFTPDLAIGYFSLELSFDSCHLLGSSHLTVELLLALPLTNQHKLASPPVYSTVSYELLGVAHSGDCEHSRF